MKHKETYITDKYGNSVLQTRIDIEPVVQTEISYTTEDELSIQHSIAESLAQEQSVSGGTQ